jgi:hypothetical protein
MPPCPQSDIINGVTPLENEWWGVHPRLYLDAEKIAGLKIRLNQPPWDRFFKQVVVGADNGSLLHAALAWLLTGEGRHRDLALEKTVKMVHDGNSGAWEELHILAMAYDWLFHDMDEPLRDMIRKKLDREARAHYHQLALHEVYAANTYGWNIALHTFMQSAVPAFALYGDVPHTAPWLRFVLEKMRVFTAALGPDGVSPEGICYGGFFDDCYVRVAALVRERLGWDPFSDNPHMRALPLFYRFSNLPARSRQAGNVHLHFGDSIRSNWYGPDFFLRYLAGVYRDPVAQATADDLSADGLSAPEGSFFNLLWHDDSVPAVAPPDLPARHHFKDKGLVVLRSGWDGEESVFGFLCGPHAGWHALENYSQCIGGGHMAPSAGTFQLFAQGDWLINDGAYSKKFTAYHNTVLVNGAGQTGEGGEWFECVELRKAKRAPAIRRVEFGTGYTVISADVAPAYDPALGLKRFFRHVVAVDPDCWVIIDDLVAGKPSTFEVLFHAWEREFQADRPFEPVGRRAWETGGGRGRLRVTSLGPEALGGEAGVQHQLGIGAHRDRDMCLLRLATAQPVRQATFVTWLEAVPAGGAPSAQVKWDGRTRELTAGGKVWRLARSGSCLRH